MALSVHVNCGRVAGQRSPMLYGHFIEHFHRQIYGGLYQPGHPLSDEDGFRTDILAAMCRIKVPILRWPGGLLRILLSLEGRRRPGAANERRRI